MNHPFFCFIHIPKCGGSTLNSILQRNLGDGYFYMRSFLCENPIPASKVKEYAQSHTGRIGIGGHPLSLQLPFSNIDGRDFYAITLVRKPMARIRSRFFYVKNLPERVGKDVLIRRYSYSEYLRYLIEHKEMFERINCSQTNYLFRDRAVDRELLTQLTRKKQLLLFPLSKFEEACIYLESAFPQYFSDNSFFKKNSNKQHITEADKELEQALSLKLTGDSYLYNLAITQTEALIAEQFSAEALVAKKKQFKKRCARRRHIYKPVQGFASGCYRKVMSL